MLNFSANEENLLLLLIRDIRNATFELVFSFNHPLSPGGGQLGQE